MDKMVLNAKGKFLKYRFFSFIYKRTGIVLKSVHVGGSQILDEKELHKEIARMIKAKIPFSLIRPGASESDFVYYFDKYLLFGSKDYKKINIYMCLNDEWSAKWVEDYKNQLKNADMIIMLAPKFFRQKYLLEEYSTCNYSGYLDEFECLLQPYSWMNALEGKRVLFISPFVDSMRKQYERIECVWPNGSPFPQMEVLFLKSIWFTAKGENIFSNWYEALSFMLDECRKIDFDIAIISCGPFSSFLADDIKRRGKQAIQYGGVLQMLFGIKGKRWEEAEDYRDKWEKYYNENWIRPSESDAPKDKNRLDGGCYW